MDLFFFKSLINKAKHENWPPLQYNGRIISDPCDKANLFNMCFESQTQLKDHGDDGPHLDPPKNLLNIIQLNTEEITAILKRLENGKACGLDRTNYRVLKATAETISKP